MVFVPYFNIVNFFFLPFGPLLLLLISISEFFTSEIILVIFRMLLTCHNSLVLYLLVKWKVGFHGIVCIDTILQFFSFFMQITEQPGCCLPLREAESIKSFQYCIQMEKPFTQGNLSGFISYQMMDSPAYQLEFSLKLFMLDFIR